MTGWVERGERFKAAAVVAVDAMQVITPDPRPATRERTRLFTKVLEVRVILSSTRLLAKGLEVRVMLSRVFTEDALYPN